MQFRMMEEAKVDRKIGISNYNPTYNSRINKTKVSKKCPIDLDIFIVYLTCCREPRFPLRKPVGNQGSPTTPPL